jgi:hypothetical protein
MEAKMEGRWKRRGRSKSIRKQRTEVKMEKEKEDGKKKKKKEEEKRFLSMPRMEKNTTCIF